MVSGGEVQRYLSGVFMLARNDQRGFNYLDLTADGFWRSFTAILYAVPAFALSWLNYRTSYIAAAGDSAATGLGFFLRLAMIDVLNWIVPVIIVALVAAPLGLTAHFGRWVIATNWLSLPFAYLMAIPVALMLLMPGAEPIAVITSLAFFGIAIAIFFRVTRIAFDNDMPVAIGITVGLVVLSFTMTGMLHAAFGLALEPLP